MQIAALSSAKYAGLAADDIGRSDLRPPLLLLHGLGFDRQMWRPVLAELEAIDPGRRAIAVDLPGHGESPDAPSYSLEAIVERVHAVAEEAALEAPVVVGHSAAASTAFVYAVMHPARGVVAVEGTLRPGPFAAMVQSLEPALRGSSFDETFGRITSSVFRLDEVSPDVREFVVATGRPRQEVVLGYWQALFELAPRDLDAMVAQGAAAIRGSQLPFLAVVGHEARPEDVEWVMSNLPEMRTEVLPHSGHFPHLAHPKRFAELLAETGRWPIHPSARVAADAAS